MFGPEEKIRGGRYWNPIKKGLALCVVKKEDSISIRSPRSTTANGSAELSWGLEPTAV